MRIQIYCFKFQVLYCHNNYSETAVSNEILALRRPSTIQYVQGVLCVQERAEHAALRGAGVGRQGGGRGGAYPHSLGSARQEVQDPISEFGVEP